jgi:hypothetical protein
MFDIVNRFREQWNNDKEDNFGAVMPIMIYRVTWKDKNTNEFFEFWCESESTALVKKSQIDLDNELSYINFESWFAYRSDEHDKRFGFSKRERGWWELKR